LLTPDEVLKLSDFGLAKDLAWSSGLTIGGGTRGYMAPEQADALTNVDHRADIYAASVMLAEILTGDPPDPELRVSGGQRLTGAGSFEGVLEPIRSPLLRGIDIDPDQRPADVESWLTELEAACTEVGAASAVELIGQRLIGTGERIWFWAELPDDATIQ
jgi:serine/threonine protein kinase